MSDDREPEDDGVEPELVLALVAEAVEVGYVEGFAEGFVDGLSDELPPGPPVRTPADSAKQFKEITDHLKSSINQQRLVAVLLAIGAIVVTVFAIGNLPEASRVGLQAIRDAALTPDGKEVANNGLAPLVTVYEIIRTTGYAALLGGLVYGMFNMARAALDQATRFDKRLVAARFLDYAIHTDNASKEQMEHALKVLEAWGANVESAYTHVKVRGKTTEPMSFSIGKDGVSMQNGQTGK
jgi:hypothetical protein